MRPILASLIVLLISFEMAFALICMGCDIKNASTPCDFNYSCPVEINTCETIVSKVEGTYSITTSCATKEKCQDKTAVYGFDICNHKL